MKHKVEITEILQKTITVDADSEDEAYWIVKQMYKNEGIVLDHTDYIDTEIEILPYDTKTPAKSCGDARYASASLGNM